MHPSLAMTLLLSAISAMRVTVGLLQNRNNVLSWKIPRLMSTVHTQDVFMPNFEFGPHHREAWTRLWTGSSQEAAFEAEDQLLQSWTKKASWRLLRPSINFRGKRVYLNTIELMPSKFAVRDKVPVVMTHGMGAGLATFYRNFDDLTMMNGGRRVLAFDWLGMGRSSRPRYPKRNAVFPQNFAANEADSVEWFVESMESWRQSMEIDQMDLVAHSMGGYFCTLYALRYPEHVRRLILVSPCGLPSMPESSASQPQALVPTDTHQTKELRELSPKENQGLREIWAQICIALWRWNITPQDILRLAGPLIRNMTKRCVETRYAQAVACTQELKLLFDYLYQINKAAVSGEMCLNALLQCCVQSDDLRGVYARRPLNHESLDKLKMPTTVLFGDRDWMYNLSVKEVVKKIPGCKRGVEFIPDSGHQIHIENAEGFNRAISRALR